MNSPFLVFLLLLFINSVACEQINVADELTPTQKLEHTVSNLQAYVQQHGCKVKRFCFSLQSTASSGELAFILQKKFVLGLANVLYTARHTQLSAVQYGSISTTISAPTNSAKKFSRSITSSTYEPAQHSSLRSPIVACDTLLFDGTNSSGVMVLIGDGTENFGGDPIVASQIFRSRNGRFFGIKVGNTSNPTVIDEIVGANGPKVVPITAFWQIRFALTQFVSSVCKN